MTDNVMRHLTASPSDHRPSGRFEVIRRYAEVHRAQAEELDQQD